MKTHLSSDNKLLVPTLFVHAATLAMRFRQMVGTAIAKASCLCVPATDFIVMFLPGKHPANWTLPLLKLQHRPTPQLALSNPFLMT